MSRTLDKQYITFYAVLGELPLDISDEQDMAAWTVQKAAYALVEKGLQNIPGRVEQDHEIESEVYDLCENDAEIVEVDGKRAYGIGFVSWKNLSRAQLLTIRDLVVRAYSEAAAKQGMSARFVHADRMNVLRVTESNRVDFDTESPDIARG